MAALLPPDWELRLTGLNTSRLTEPDWQWAHLIMLSARYIRRAGLLALVREAKHRGKTVVVGGPYPTSLPEAALGAGGDFVGRGCRAGGIFAFFKTAPGAPRAHIVKF